MLPQFAALKGKTADKPGIGTGLAQTPVCNTVEGRLPEKGSVTRSVRITSWSKRLGGSRS
jgi:hypothetical protein